MIYTVQYRRTGLDFRWSAVQCSAVPLLGYFVKLEVKNLPATLVVVVVVIVTHCTAQGFQLV